VIVAVFGYAEIWPVLANGVRRLRGRRKAQTEGPAPAP
jgi:hypothetical protein